MPTANSLLLDRLFPVYEKIRDSLYEQNSNDLWSEKKAKGLIQRFLFERFLVASKYAGGNVPVPSVWLSGESDAPPVSLKQEDVAEALEIIGSFEFGLGEGFLSADPSKIGPEILAYVATDWNEDETDCKQSSFICSIALWNHLRNQMGDEYSEFCYSVAVDGIVPDGVDKNVLSWIIDEIATIRVADPYAACGSYLVAMHHLLFRTARLLSNECSEPFDSKGVSWHIVNLTLHGLTHSDIECATTEMRLWLSHLFASGSEVSILEGLGSQIRLIGSAKPSYQDMFPLVFSIKDVGFDIIVGEFEYGSVCDSSVTDLMSTRSSICFKPFESGWPWANYSNLFENLSHLLSPDVIVYENSKVLLVSASHKEANHQALLERPGRVVRLGTSLDKLEASTSLRGAFTGLVGQSDDHVALSLIRDGSEISGAQS